MSSSIPKTGLAERVREWMKARTGTKRERRFTVEELCAALCIPEGKEHQRVRNLLGDFMDRKEVETYKTKKPNRRQYLYQHDWCRELKGKLNRKIFKAMYVSHDFAIADIQRLTGLQDRSWIDKTVRQLISDGHLQQIRRRLCAHGAGVEAIYHIPNRDKFKLEVMR